MLQAHHTNILKIKSFSITTEYKYYIYILYTTTDNGNWKLSDNTGLIY